MEYIIEYNPYKILMIRFTLSILFVISSYIYVE